MAETSLACQFVFTDTEYRKSIDCLYRGHARGIQLLFLGIILVFIALITCGLYLEYKDGQLSDKNGLKWGDVLSAETPFGSGFVILLILMYTPLYAFIFQFYFRGQPERNQHVTFTISASKVVGRMNGVDKIYPWETVTGAKESKAGFLLLAGKRGWMHLCYWLPKHGFASPEAIEQCRVLIREHIKDFKRLNF
jgi:hypothetical protein